MTIKKLRTFLVKYWLYGLLLIALLAGALFWWIQPTLLQQFVNAYDKAGTEKREVFETFLPVLGVDVLLDFVETRFPQCHSQAHELGRTIFSQNTSLELALDMCSHRCTSGCMHGVVLEAFREKTFNEVSSQLNDYCSLDQMANQYKPGNCAHSLGHALMFAAQYDIEKTLRGCEQFQLPAMRYYCATGSYMEFFSSGNSQARASFHDPCDRDDTYPAACYRYRLLELMVVFGEGWLQEKLENIVSECTKLTALARWGCFSGLGNAARTVAMKHPDRLRQFCSHGDLTDQIMCVEGAIEKWTDYDIQQARDACLQFDSPLAQVCVEATQNGMYHLDKATLKYYLSDESNVR